MRIANVAGRLTLVTGENRGIDIERASAGRFGADPQAIYEQWYEFRSWAAGQGDEAAEAFDAALVGAPTPRPRQIFAIGLNYRDHAAEVGIPLPAEPSVFTKFVTSITGPTGSIGIPAGGKVDWEVEIVAVIGRQARFVREADAWDHVAGLTVAQDISERVTQNAGGMPQFAMGKSFDSFTPIGPCVVTPDAVADRDALTLGCSLNGEIVQHGTSENLVFTIPQTIAYLSKILTLLPGDIILTGTPAGVGFGRDPQRFMAPGDELVTWVEGIGEMRHTLVDADKRSALENLTPQSNPAA
ncbi:fumarylacetoacetate hydrolase family protein [Streptomyces sp. NPDC050625]|uniref:fumarylacetoacetate hydrolase family protein n=1 Tax=Streptomyces sp. NPDC050625 TaxID=3154629 RepID=UPI0034167FE2